MYKLLLSSFLENEEIDKLDKDINYKKVDYDLYMYYSNSEIEPHQEHTYIIRDWAEASFQSWENEEEIIKSVNMLFTQDKLQEIYKSNDSYGNFQALYQEAISVE